MTKITIKTKNPKPTKISLKDIPEKQVFGAKAIKYPQEGSSSPIFDSDDGKHETNLWTILDGTLMSLRTFNRWNLKMADYYAEGYSPKDKIEIVVSE